MVSDGASGAEGRVQAELGDVAQSSPKRPKSTRRHGHEATCGSSHGKDLARLHCQRTARFPDRCDIMVAK